MGQAIEGDCERISLIYNERISHMPGQRRMTTLAIVKDFGKEQVHVDMIPKKPIDNVERHRGSRELTTTIYGSLAEAIASEREKSGWK